MMIIVIIARLLILQVVKAKFFNTGPSSGIICL